MSDKLLTSLPGTVQLSSDYRTSRIASDLRSAKQVRGDEDESRLRAACSEMESLFLTQLLKEMRATVEKSGFISGGRAEEIFTSMLDVEISRKMSAAGGIGLSAILLQQLGGKAEK